MRKVLICSFLICLGLVISSGAATISFNPAESGAGARTLGMGGAFAGLADDASAIFVNPAGIASLPELRLTSMYSTLLNDESYLVLGGTNRYAFGDVGLGYINVASPNIPIYQWIGGVPTIVGYTNYSSGTLYLSYAKHLQEHLLVGGSLKIFTQGFSGGGATYESTSGTGLDLDLGVKYWAQPWLSLGLSLQNLLPASLGGKFSWKNGQEEGIPVVAKAGLALDLFGKKALRPADAEVTLLLDYDDYRESEAITHLGMEYRPLPLLALRLGSNNGNLAIGLGYKYAGFDFDYAYRRLGAAETNVSQAFSISYQAGWSKPAPGSGPKAETKAEKVRQLSKKSTLPLFIDVPKDHYASQAIETLAVLEIIPGYADGTFQPGKETTRAELSVALIRSLGGQLPTVDERIFKDLPIDHWSTPYIKAAVDQELITGYPDGTFRPNWPVKRAEAVAILARFDNFPETGERTSLFVDIPADYWANTMIAEAKKRGIIAYVQEDLFEPEKKVTRAEAAEMLFRTDFVQGKLRLNSLDAKQ